MARGPEGEAVDRPGDFAPVNPNAMVSLRARVRGRTQGVGFRVFVQYKARDLGLTGYARNLGDGVTVEVVAEGPRRDVETLLDHLRAGPPSAFVERVDVSWGEASGRYDRFATG